MDYKLYDVVKTTIAIPDAGISAGDTGTIVDIYSDGEFEIEFADNDGATIAMVALGKHEIELAHQLRHAA